MLPSGILKTSSWYKCFFPKCNSSGLAPATLSCQELCQNISEAHGKCRSCASLNQAVWFGLWDVLVVQCAAFCCLLLPCNPGPLETTVFVFDVLVEVGLSLQKQRLQPSKGLPGFISLDDDVQLWQIVGWHLSDGRGGCVCAHVWERIWSCLSFRGRVQQWVSQLLLTSLHLFTALSSPGAFDHSHCLILVQHLCKTRNLEEHLASIKGF